MKHSRKIYHIALLSIGLFAVSPPSARAQFGGDAPPVEVPPAQEAPTPEAPPAEAKPPAQAKPSEPKPVPMPDAVPQAGEIRLDGKVTGMVGPGEFLMEAVSFTTVAGKTVEFAEAKTKTIVVASDALVRAPLPSKKPYGVKDIALGARVSVAGKDGGSGKPLQAREVVLRDEDDHQTIGQVFTHPATSRLIREADKATESGQVQLATTLLNTAVETAARLEDWSGQGLAFNRLGLLQRDANEYDKALATFNRGLVAVRRAGDASSEATMWLNIGSVQLEAGQVKEAISSLEKAAGSDEPRGRLFALLHLGRAYARNEQAAPALDAFQRAMALATELGEDETLGRLKKGVVIVSLQAQLNAANQAADAGRMPDEGALRRGVTEAEAQLPLFEAEAERHNKAELLFLLGQVAQGLRDKTKAAERYEAAKELFTLAGEAERAAEVSVRLAEMKTAAP